MRCIIIGLLPSLIVFWAATYSIGRGQKKDSCILGLSSTERLTQKFDRSEIVPIVIQPILRAVYLRDKTRPHRLVFSDGLLIKDVLSTLTIVGSLAENQGMSFLESQKQHHIDDSSHRFSQNFTIFLLFTCPNDFVSARLL